MVAPLLIQRLSHKWSHSPPPNNGSPLLIYNVYLTSDLTHPPHNGSPPPYTTSISQVISPPLPTMVAPLLIQRLSHKWSHSPPPTMVAPLLIQRLSHKWSHSPPNNGSPLLIQRLSHKWSHSPPPNNGSPPPYTTSISQVISLTPQQW